MSTHPAGLDELIGEIYENVGDSEALSRTIMEIVGLTRSRAAQFGVLDQDWKRLQAWNVGIDIWAIQSHLANNQRADPRAVSLSHPAQVVQCQPTVADQEACQRSVPPTEFLNKVDSRLAVASLVPVGPEVSVGFGIMRSRPYSEEEVKTMTVLLQHIVRAMTLHIKFATLQSHARSLEAMMDKIATPALLVDRTGTLRYANAAGNETLAKGTYLMTKSGCVIAQDPRQRRELENIISTALSETAAEMAGTHVTGALRLQGVDGRTALLIVHAFRGQPDLAGIPQAHAALFITGRHDNPVPDPIRLQHIFDLTPAETRLVEHLLNGESLNDIADRVHVSRETLRTQLRSLFAKTDTRRQAELLARLLGAVSVPLT